MLSLLLLLHSSLFLLARAFGKPLPGFFEFQDTNPIIYLAVSCIFFAQSFDVFRTVAVN